MIYEPSDDSYLLAEIIKLKVKGKSFLDVGTGSGIQSQTAKNSGAKEILASDINPESVSLLKSLGFKSVKSNLFSNISRTFDVIAFNPPYLPEDNLEDFDSREITTGGKEGDEISLAFLEQAPKHLTKNGKILLLISSLTPKPRILNLLEKNNLKSLVLTKKKLFMETLEVWEIHR